MILYKYFTFFQISTNSVLIYMYVSILKIWRIKELYNILMEKLSVEKLKKLFYFEAYPKYCMCFDVSNIHMYTFICENLETKL